MTSTVTFAGREDELDLGFGEEDGLVEGVTVGKGSRD